MIPLSIIYSTWWNKRGTCTTIALITVSSSSLSVITPNLSLFHLCFLQVSLNEQFMVASVSPEGDSLPTEESKNRVLRVFMRRLGSSKTFGENMIFMLNRAG